MKEYDTVELIADREEYNKEGVYKGMFGTIMSSYSIGGTWQVIFTEENSPKDIADLAVREEDLRVYDETAEKDSSEKK